jgi:hypothetical protein
MDAVPYEIRPDDVDEVLNAYAPTGDSWPDEERDEAIRHVMSSVLDLNETVRTAPEAAADEVRGAENRAGPVGDRPGDRSEDRRELALAAIEDLLIRDGFIDVDDDEPRAFPAPRGPIVGRED